MNLRQGNCKKQVVVVAEDDNTLEEGGENMVVSIKEGAHIGGVSQKGDYIGGG